MELVVTFRSKLERFQAVGLTSDLSNSRTRD